MLPIAWIIFLLFFPASLFILLQAIGANELSHQLLAFVLLLFSLEQARMAAVDLEAVAEAKKQVQNDGLNKFNKIVVSTIVIELIGFYLSSFSLGWGIIVVVLSQVWFNLFAKIEIERSEKVVIHPRGISGRLPVLVANFLALILVGLWLLNIASLGIAVTLAMIAIAYGSSKYIFSTRKYESHLTLPKS